MSRSAARVPGAHSVSLLVALAALVASALPVAPAGGAAPARAKPRCADPADCRLYEAGARAGVRFGLASSNGSAQHQATLLAEANVVVNHEFSWSGIEPDRGEWDFTEADDDYAFATEHGLYQIGMHFAWDQQFLDDLPAWVVAITDADELRAVLAERARVIFERYPEIDLIDVINEPFQTLGSEIYRNHFYEVLGPDYVSELFAIVEAEAPVTTELMVNEAGIEYQPDKADALIALVAQLVSEGHRVDAVGLQTHLSVGEPDWEVLRSTMRRIEALGVKPFVSELDVPVPATVPGRYEVQAGRYRRVVEACLTTRTCDIVNVWGVSDADTWYDWMLYPDLDPLLFDDGFAPKPAYFAVRDALLGGRLRPPPPGPVVVPDGSGEGSFDYELECRTVVEPVPFGYGEIADLVTMFTDGNPVRLSVPVHLQWTPATTTGGTIDYRVEAELDLGEAAYLSREETARPAIGLGGYLPLVDTVWIALDATEVTLTYPHPVRTSLVGTPTATGAASVVAGPDGVSLTLPHVAGDSRAPNGPVGFGGAWKVRTTRPGRRTVVLPLPSLTLDLGITLGVAFLGLPVSGGARGPLSCDAIGTVPVPVTTVRPRPHAGRRGGGRQPGRRG